MPVNHSFIIIFLHSNEMNMVKGANHDKISKKKSRKAAFSPLSILQGLKRSWVIKPIHGKNSISFLQCQNLLPKAKSAMSRIEMKTQPSSCMRHPFADIYWVVMALLYGKTSPQSKTFAPYWSTWKNELMTLAWFKNYFAHRLIP